MSKRLQIDYVRVRDVRFGEKTSLVDGVLTLNKQELLAQMDLFAEKFSELRTAIAQDDRAHMRRIMRLSTERRAYFDTPREDTHEH